MLDNSIRLKRFLTDALDAANNVRMETTGMGPRLFFQSNIRWLVERGIEIISEALKRSVAIDPSLAVTDLKKIYATRNKIAHEYDAVDPYLLHTIVVRSIPKLIEELEALIAQMED